MKKKYLFSFSVPGEHLDLEFDQSGKPRPKQDVIEVEAENKAEAKEKAEALFKERHPCLEPS
jgi:hypothetical protein